MVEFEVEFNSPIILMTIAHHKSDGTFIESTNDSGIFPPVFAVHSMHLGST